MVACRPYHYLFQYRRGSNRIPIGERQSGSARAMSPCPGADTQRPGTGAGRQRPGETGQREDKSKKKTRVKLDSSPSPLRLGRYVTDRKALPSPAGSPRRSNTGYNTYNWEFMYFFINLTFRLPHFNFPSWGRCGFLADELLPGTSSSCILLTIPLIIIIH